MPSNRPLGFDDLAPVRFALVFDLCQLRCFSQARDCRPRGASPEMGKMSEGSGEFLKVFGGYVRMTDLRWCSIESCGKVKSE